MENMFCIMWPGGRGVVMAEGVGPLLFHTRAKAENTARTCGGVVWRVGDVMPQLTKILRDNGYFLDEGHVPLPKVSVQFSVGSGKCHNFMMILVAGQGHGGDIPKSAVP